MSSNWRHNAYGLKEKTEESPDGDYQRSVPMLTGTSLINAAFLSGGLLLAFSGCSTSNSFGSAHEIEVWAEQRDFSKTTVQTGKFRIAAFVRKPPVPNDTLTIYVEGDGAAWLTPYHPPSDPTPIKPVSLVLAVADPSVAVVYLGRPCQYLSEKALQACDRTYWTERRFAPEVVAAYDATISLLKSTFGARQLKLVGYSGGGVLVTLLAAQRNDVDVLVTVAAPLAINKWTAEHKVSPLKGSLDPAELGENVRLTQGVHFVGGRDEIVPPAVVGHFIRRKGGRMEVIPDFDHECCWARDWVALLGRVKLRENAK
jgi:hypothetical protein